MPFVYVAAVPFYILDNYVGRCVRKNLQSNHYRLRMVHDYL